MSFLSVFESYEITSLTVNRALNKLAKGGVEAFNVKKINKNTIRLSVKAKDSQKIFAIFRGSCYTINKTKEKGIKKFLSFALYRLGAIIGSLLFLFIILFSQSFVFKIEVTGSGSHYADEVKSLLSQEGLSFFSLYDKNKAELARSEILKLPAVSFCSVRKSGYVIFVGVEINAETPKLAPLKNLTASVSGTLVQLVTVRGTPLVKEGDKINKGEVIVAGYELYGEDKKVETPAIAKAILECELVYEYTAYEESEKALTEAYAKAVLLIGESEITDKGVNVIKSGDAFVYQIQIKYTAIIAVNMD